MPQLNESELEPPRLNLKGVSSGLRITYKISIGLSATVPPLQWAGGGFIEYTFEVGGREQRIRQEFRFGHLSEARQKLTSDANKALDAFRSG